MGSQSCRVYLMHIHPLLLSCVMTRTLRMHVHHRKYFESVHSTRDGEEGAPITIAGPPSAVIRGHLAEHVISVNHDYIHLEGFSVNGEG